MGTSLAEPPEKRFLQPLLQQRNSAIPFNVSSADALGLCSLDLLHSFGSSQALVRLQEEAIFKSVFSEFSLTSISSCSASAPIIASHAGSGCELIVAEEELYLMYLQSIQISMEINPHVVSGVCRVTVSFGSAQSCSCRQPITLSLFPSRAYVCLSAAALRGGAKPVQPLSRYQARRFSPTALSHENMSGEPLCS